MSNNNVTTPDGLATSQQVKALTETLSTAGIHWHRYEDELNLANQRLEETLNALHETKAQLTLAKSKFDEALEYASNSEVVKTHIEENDSKKVIDDINAIRSKLDSLSLPNLIPVRKLIKDLEGAIKDWKNEKNQIKKKNKWASTSSYSSRIRQRIR